MSSKGSKRKRTTSPNSKGGLKPTGYILECDAPVKQFVMYNDSTRHDDKKWVIADLDETHLLVNRKYRNEIERKVDDWMDGNVFSSVEKVGEDLDMS